MIEIPLTRGKYASIDDIDADLADTKWYASYGAGEFYAVRYIRITTNIRKMVRMHRVILERILGRKLNQREVVDHVDGNGLHNTRDNIRLATYTQNSANARKCNRTTTSNFRGVSWHRASGKWRATIRCNGACKHLGIFDTETEAAIAYDAHARNLFGDFCKLNFTDEVMER